jgi:hypothetical protein
VTGGWRKLHNEELHNLYSSPSTYNQMMKLWSKKWAGHGGEDGFIQDFRGKARKEATRKT